MVQQELVVLLTDFTNSRDNDLTICSLRTRKTEDKISCGLGERGNQLNQTSISSDEKVKVHKLLQIEEKVHA